MTDQVWKSKVRQRTRCFSPLTILVAIVLAAFVVVVEATRVERLLAIVLAIAVLAAISIVSASRRVRPIGGAGRLRVATVIWFASYVVVQTLLGPIYNGNLALWTATAAVLSSPVVAAAVMRRDRS